jgi:predicted enzyme related to lactoylglutathione lyase
MKKVTGIGGIFFKCKDAGKMRDWYAKNLGLSTSEWGTNFDWRQADDLNKKGSTAWSPFPENTTHFEPSTKDYMINYLVENIDELVEQLKSDGVTIIDQVEASDYGKFVHILDPEGNKVELWEPIDEE